MMQMMLAQVYNLAAMYYIPAAISPEMSKNFMNIQTKL
jgi:hypothetical protein